MKVNSNVHSRSLHINHNEVLVQETVNLAEIKDQRSGGLTSPAVSRNSTDELAIQTTEAPVEVLKAIADFTAGPGLDDGGIPRVIADYRVIRKIGEGGMGVVYEAEQQHPRRLVALKVIRGGRYVDEHYVKLFQREAHTLARLKHPGIAAIYESGRTEEGRHFFTMELVRGETLKDYMTKLRGTRSPTAAGLKLRLALFGKICEAVNYAQQRGVIHRDLKPSNIVILRDSTSRNGASTTVPVPDIKILDFGLARLTETDVTTIITEMGQIQGTLAYMSPEQIRGNPDEIDVRSDVYSLGVILYELMTGQLPYNVQRLRLPEAIRTICEETAAAPSKVANCVRQLDSDIDTIVLKALEKDPSRRYQSAGALAEDLQRYLAGQPILALPPSALYQLRKLVARHKVSFAFAATLLVFLAGLALIMTAQASRIARERDRANQEANAALQVSQFLTGLFEVSDPGKSRGNTITAREILDRGAEKVARELGNQPLTRARLEHTIGVVFRKLGLYERAASLLESSRDIRLSKLGERNTEVADSLNELATVYQEQGQYAKAEPLFQRSVAILQEVYGPNHIEVGRKSNNLALLWELQGNHERAERLFQSALVILQKDLGPEHPDVAEIINNLSGVSYAQGQYDKTESLLKRALAIYEKALGTDHPDVAMSSNNLGVLYWDQNQYEKAEPLLKRALEIAEKTLGPEHSDTARYSANLGNLYLDQGELAKAEPLYLRSLKIREKVLGKGHPDVAHSLDRLGMLYQKQNRHAEAEPLLKRAVEVSGSVLGQDHPDLAVYLNHLANFYRDRDQLVKAEPLYLRSLAILRKALGPDHPNVAKSLENYAALLRKAKRTTEAESMAARAREINGRRMQPNSHG